MAEYVTHGIDLMIDYDHASLASVTLDPAQAGKAAGWFNLEMRGGELWAVNVRWTLPAADALSRNEWRFVSPAFETQDGHITSLLNVAITNLPATRKLQPLMAANINMLGTDAMSIEEFLKVCKALGLDMAMPMSDAMAKIQGGAAEDAAAAADAPAEEPPVAAADPAPAPPAADEKKDAPEAVAASIARFMRLSGKASFVDAAAEAEVWRASHLTLETERQSLAAERQVLEAAARRKGCVELVTQAGRAPATVWADDKSSAPKAYLANMSITDFNEYVSDAIKAAGSKTAPKPPVSKGSKGENADVDALGLTERDRQMCKESGCEPAVFAELKARRDAAKKG